MRKISYLSLLIVAVTFASCKESWKKAPEGMEYKIIADGKGATIKSGDFVELQITSVLNNGKKDSVLSSTYESGMPEIRQFDTVSIPPAFFAMFKQLRKGDSLATKMLTDSIFKKQPEQMPPFMKKGNFLYTNIRVVNIYKTREEAEKAREAAMKVAQEVGAKKAVEQAKTDDKLLSDFIAGQHVKATKTSAGTYVEIIQPGSGPMIDTSVVAKINYTGKFMNGVIFDSNTDPSKGNVMPLTVNLTSNPMLGTTVVPGMSEGLKLLNKGAKAKLYIPSGLAYGPQPNPNMPANSNLIFEVEVLEVMNKTQAAAEMAAMQKKMIDMQKDIPTAWPKRRMQ